MWQRWLRSLWIFLLWQRLRLRRWRRFQWAQRGVRRKCRRYPRPGRLRQGCPRLRLPRRRLKFRLFPRCPRPCLRRHRSPRRLGGKLLCPSRVCPSLRMCPNWICRICLKHPKFPNCLKCRKCLNCPNPPEARRLFPGRRHCPSPACRPRRIKVPRPNPPCRRCPQCPNSARRMLPRRPSQLSRPSPTCQCPRSRLPKNLKSRNQVSHPSHPNRLCQSSRTTTRRILILNLKRAPRRRRSPRPKPNPPRNQLTPRARVRLPPPRRAAPRKKLTLWIPNENHALRPRRL